MANSKILKFVQIISVGSSYVEDWGDDTHPPIVLREDHVMALAEDGTVWKMNAENGSWERMGAVHIYETGRD